MPRVTLRQSNSRLERLCRLLDTLPSSRFDYGVWVGRDWQGDPELSCGTVACAGGWATTIPAFQAKGLSLTSVAGQGEVRLAQGTGGIYGLDALARFFGITHAESQYLFHPAVALYREHPFLRGYGPGPQHRARPKTVARHIRRFMAARAAYHKRRKAA